MSKQSEGALADQACDRGTRNGLLARLSRKQLEAMTRHLRAKVDMLENKSALHLELVEDWSIRATMLQGLFDEMANEAANYGAGGTFTTQCKSIMLMVVILVVIILEECIPEKTINPVDWLDIGGLLREDRPEEGTWDVVQANIDFRKKNDDDGQMIALNSHSCRQ